ncbi:guanylate-binding protein 3-like [Ochotona princeps]|uniref:guanylate-binding protein 3-like n=1 Tax=Ochotona princeps TaxID=9978 RepID=UPI00271497CD|nr:guanylate-binding protein 3-like [Ochotona princeps]
MIRAEEIRSQEPGVSSRSSTCVQGHLSQPWLLSHSQMNQKSSNQARTSKYRPCYRPRYKFYRASKFTRKTAICLVENKDEQLMVNPRALNILSRISQPVVVVAIVGLCRTGKSYLLNRVARQKHGFRLGSTVQSETKGIWMCCVPHPSKRNHTLVLLDTEGLGDVEKGDPKNDSWIFALAVLLSSTLVYNSLGTINHQALEQLHYVTELSQLIRTRASPTSDEAEDCTEFVHLFPDFVWAVRDFSLELKLQERHITEDEYLENALKLIPGENPRIQNSNMTRNCIRDFFPKRKCFVFPRPTNDNSLLAHIQEVSEDQLESTFKSQSEEFCSYISTHGKVKTLGSGITVTGKRLGCLVEMYVNAINSGAVPCLENAVTTLAERENAAAVEKAAAHYMAQMAERVMLPADTLQELLDMHTVCEKEAIEVFMEHSFKDDNLKFQKTLMETIEEKKEYFLEQNEEASSKYCQTEIKKLSESLMENISRGTFCVPQGHKLYQEARRKVEQDYKLVPRKGVKASEVLRCFLESLEATEKFILNADKALTEMEKTLEAKNTKREAMEDQHRITQEVIIHLKENWEKEKENLLQQQEKLIEQKLREQEERLKQKLKVVEEMLNKEFKTIKEVIEELNRRIPDFGNNEKSDFFSWILNNIVTLTDLFWKAKKL